jgi:glycosyltransferase involved in cell wall biosynthesis
VKVSVVIPTLNSEKVIKRVLDAIFQGTCKPHEVIVVDGGSHDQTVAFSRDFPVRTYHNPKIHAAAARNIGIQQASGAVIAFTDSDCVPQKNWLALIDSHFSADSELIGVGGRMLSLPPVNKVETFSSHVFLNDIMNFPLESRHIKKRALAGAFITANCAYRREVLLKVGGFRDVFGNNAEDIDLFWRLIGLGLLFYDPDIVVYHSFPDNWKSLSKKYFQHGIASSKLARYHLGTPSVDWSLYRKLARNLIRIPVRKEEWAFLYCLQICTHILGKIYGSLMVHRINL